MSNIVVAFPKEASAMSIRKILTQSGYPVTAVCTTGAQALQRVGELGGGILVCGNRFVDMMYTELYEYMPKDFQMLLIASPQAVQERQVNDIVCLELPLKVHELLDTLEMMEMALRRLRKKQRQKPKERSKEDMALMTEAKNLLMGRNSMTEEEAHRYIQKSSMDNGTSLVETAQMIVSLYREG